MKKSLLEKKKSNSILYIPPLRSDGKESVVIMYATTKEEAKELLTMQEADQMAITYENEGFNRVETRSTSTVLLIRGQKDDKGEQ